MRTGRFSTGIEQDPDSPDKERVGTFATGIGRPDAPRRIGTFATGIERVPGASARRVGSFADGYVRPVPEAVRRADARGAVATKQAA